MQRRSFFSTAAAGALGLFGLTRARADTAGRQTVVYHLDDPDKVAFALANMRNHIEGVGGAGKADIRIVVNGAALRAFRTGADDARIAGVVENLQKEQVGFEACANTMRALGLTIADLLPGFVPAEKGGVVRLAELQMQGYAYIKP